MLRIEAVPSTTTIPESHCPVRVLRKVHLTTSGIKHLRSLVGHGLTETEAVPSTSPLLESGGPLEELLWEDLVENVSESVVITEYSGWRSLRQRRAFRSLGAQYGFTEKIIWGHFGSNFSEDLLANA